MATWAAVSPETFLGRVVGNGHCAAFIRASADAPHVSEWRRGESVRTAAELPKGQAIATFDADGRYSSRTGHAAILIARHADGVLVWDQWKGHPVQQRVVRYRGGQGDAINDADQFYVVTDDDAAAA
jgi:hypothetical protein